MKIYIAGKISQDDFRFSLVRRLRGHSHDDGPLNCGAFNYVGPFFETCDHGCSHGPTAHGVLGIPGLGCENFDRSTRARVWQRNMQALQSASAVFAYIETNDAYGTLVELGVAHTLKKRTWVLFGPGVDADEMWYASQGTSWTWPRGACYRNVVRRDLLANFANFLAEVAK